MKLSLALLGLVAVSCLSACPAIAQENQGAGFPVDTKQLQQPVMRHSRPQIQIIDTSPIITDKRQPPQGPNNLILNIAPLQPSAGTTTVINVGQPGSAASGTPVAGPGQVMINLDRPPSGLQSNMNSLKSPVGLPNGTTTNRLGHSAIGKVAGTLKPAARPAAQQPLGRLATPASNTPAMYPQSRPAGVSSSSQMTATTSTSARLLQQKQAAKK